MIQFFVKRTTKFWFSMILMNSHSHNIYTVYQIQLVSRVMAINNVGAEISVFITRFHNRSSSSASTHSGFPAYSKSTRAISQGITENNPSRPQVILRRETAPPKTPHCLSPQGVKHTRAPLESQPAHTVIMTPPLLGNARPEQSPISRR